MRIVLRRASIAVFVAIAVLSVPTHGQTRRFITERDLLKFTWIADPQIAPDGTSVAYVRVTANEKDDKYETSLFLMPSNGGEGRRLTSGTRDTGPRWSPDGKRIAFVRAVEKEGKPQPGQIYMLSMDGGEARPLTDIASGAADPVWSPDGAHIAFTSATPAEGAKKADEAKAPGERKSDVQVVTRAVYRENGNPGYVDTMHHSHIFTISGPGPIADNKLSAPTQITDGEFDENGPTWAPDGSKIYFTSTRVAEPYYTEAGDELFVVASSGGGVGEGGGVRGGNGPVSGGAGGEGKPVVRAVDGPARRL